MHKTVKVFALATILTLSLACMPLSQTAIPPATSTNAPIAKSTRTPIVVKPSVTSHSIQIKPTLSQPSAPISLNLSGPHILLGGQEGIWIANPDGSFLTQLSQTDFQTDLQRSVSPAGDAMVFVTQNDQGLDLTMISLPSGESQTIAQLLAINSTEQLDNTSQKAFVMYAIRDYENATWQPAGGHLIAFTGAINGATSDLYTYDTQTGEIKQLTSGASLSVMPSWSPDGQYILNFGVSWVPPFGGAIGQANQLNGVWAVRISDGKIISLPRPKSDFPGNITWFLGWQDDSHYIIYDYSSSSDCPAQNLRSVDVTDGQSTTLLNYGFYSEIARSPENGAMLFTGTDACTGSPGDGTYLLTAGQSVPTKILDKKVYEIDWLANSKVFFAYPEALISPDGQTRYDPPVYDASYDPAISKDGFQAWQVIQNQKGRVEVKLPGQDWHRILDGTVSKMAWVGEAGDTLLIVQDSGDVYIASAPDFTPHLMGQLGTYAINQIVWVP